MITGTAQQWLHSWTIHSWTGSKPLLIIGFDIWIPLTRRAGEMYYNDFYMDSVYFQGEVQDSNLRCAAPA